MRRHPIPRPQFGADFHDLSRLADLATSLTSGDSTALQAVLEQLSVPERCAWVGRGGEGRGGGEGAGRRAVQAVLGRRSHAWAALGRTRVLAVPTTRCLVDRLTDLMYGSSC